MSTVPSLTTAYELKCDIVAEMPVPYSEIADYNFSQGDLVYFTVKKDIKDKEYALQKVVSEFIDNVAMFELNKHDTNIEVGEYIYDIQVSLHDGKVDTIVLPSKFEVIEGVTNE